MEYKTTTGCNAFGFCRDKKETVILRIIALITSIIVSGLCLTSHDPAFGQNFKGTTKTLVPMYYIFPTFKEASSIFGHYAESMANGTHLTNCDRPF